MRRVTSRNESSKAMTETAAPLAAMDVTDALAALEALEATGAETEQVVALLDEVAKGSPIMASDVLLAWGRNRTVDGNLRLIDRAWVTALPEGLAVAGWLALSGCAELASLPDGLKVGTSLYLCDCRSLGSLPAGLEVGGGLDLSGCAALTALPRDMRLAGDLVVDPGGPLAMARKPVRGR
jgi:hypothetical protein